LPVALQIGGWVLMDTYRYLVEGLVALEQIDDARARRVRGAESPGGGRLFQIRRPHGGGDSGDGGPGARRGGDGVAEALRLIEEARDPTRSSRARMALGRSLHALGDVTGARTELERACALCAHRRERRAGTRSTASWRSWWRAGDRPAPPPSKCVSRSGRAATSGVSELADAKGRSCRSS
jgi:hypothetical protein